MGYIADSYCETMGKLSRIPHFKPLVAQAAIALNIFGTTKKPIKKI
jgi:hypothetical protein